MQVKKNRIEFYSSFFMGHTLPLAKFAEVVQRRFKEYEVVFITFEIAKNKLQKDFPSLNFIGIKPEFTKQKEREMTLLPPHELFPALYSVYQEYFAEKKELPALIISDFFAIQAANFAKKHGVKSLVNFPNSYGTVHDKFNFVSI